LTEDLFVKRRDTGSFLSSSDRSSSISTSNCAHLHYSLLPMSRVSF